MQLPVTPRPIPPYSFGIMAPKYPFSTILFLSSWGMGSQGKEPSSMPSLALQSASSTKGATSRLNSSTSLASCLCSFVHQGNSSTFITYLYFIKSSLVKNGEKIICSNKTQNFTSGTSNPLNILQRLARI